MVRSYAEARVSGLAVLSVPKAVLARMRPVVADGGVVTNVPVAWANYRVPPVNVMTDPIHPTILPSTTAPLVRTTDQVPLKICAAGSKRVSTVKLVPSKSPAARRTVRSSASSSASRAAR